SHLISGIYLPLRSTEAELETIARTLGEEAKKYGVTITAGQTATYYGLDIPLLTSTCIGKSIRSTQELTPGDKALIIGEVGGEAVWLDKLSTGEKTEAWRSFTPLPVITSLQGINGINIMHDVSEGGIKGALYEMVASNGYGLEISSKNIELYPGVEKLTGDIFRAPTYGVLIVISKSNSVDEIQEKCRQLDVPCSIVGDVILEKRVIFDKQTLREQKRVDIDEIYGSFKKKDRLLDELTRAVDRLLKIEELVDIIPQVGMNIIYAKPSPEKEEDIAGLSGRIIKAMKKPMLCGEIKYGASKYLASVILQAQKIDESKRAAINLKYNSQIEKRLRAMGLKVKLLPSKIIGEGCPVALYLDDAESLHDAYLHPGDFGVEPTSTIIGENPDELVKMIYELVSFERQD
ncbi:hypothetical protein GF326_12080, partial [Candidatus Bathyarchaeota archaeon]|nr:hypothetical protein [Candidatus Bathyarchaeota archaeon]